MSEAKNLKMREYGTNVISHDSTTPSGDGVNVRFNNTFKSSIMDGPIPEANSRMHEARSRDRLYKENPLRNNVQRASY